MGLFDWGAARPPRVAVPCPRCDRPDERVLKTDCVLYGRLVGEDLLSWVCTEQVEGVRSIRVFREMNGGQSNLLRRAGVKTERLPEIPELYEVHLGPELTGDDLLALHNYLEQDGTIGSL